MKTDLKKSIFIVYVLIAHPKLFQQMKEFGAFILCSLISW